MSLCTLVYVSLSTRQVSDADLTTLLESCRANNRKLDVTGMLLYRDGFYMQALEGEEQVIDELYGTIRRDLRHSDILLVYKETISERTFPEWSMGFNTLNASHVESLEGFNDFLKNPNLDFFANQPNKAKKLLNNFRTRHPFADLQQINLADAEKALSSLLDADTNT